MVLLDHRAEAGIAVGIEVAERGFLQKRNEKLQTIPPRHPLEIFAAVVFIGAVEFGPGHEVGEPLEYIFVADVHTESDLRLFPISPEVPFPNQYPKDESQ